jgi:hypothetical protein
MVIDPAPATAVIAGLPAQVVYAFGVGATTIPAGSGSTTPTVVRAAAPEFESRTVTVDRPPEDTPVGLKLFIADNEDV